MIIGVYGFLSNENKSSVKAFIAAINTSSKVAEASISTIKYFSESSVLYMFLTMDIIGINDIRLNSSPIYAPSHEFEDIDTNIPLTNVISNRILVELLGIREKIVYSIYGV
jgi:hypothetical protein